MQWTKTSLLHFPSCDKQLWGSLTWSQHGKWLVELYWYSFYIHTNSSRIHILLPEGCSMLTVPANFVYSQGLYHITLVLFMSKCIRHDIWDLLECWILALLWWNLAAAQNNFVSQQEAKWARIPCLAGTEGKRGGESLWKQEVIAHTRTGSRC